MSIWRKEYLVFYISNDHGDKYINIVLSDIQLEQKYKHIVVFVEDITKIPISKYRDGLYEILIIPYTEANKRLLSKITLIDWYKILCALYPNNKVIFSKYDFIDYVTDDNRYINHFTFVDSEKIYDCKMFLRQNPSKELDIVCTKEILGILKQEIPDANYKIVSLDNIEEPTHYN